MLWVTAGITTHKIGVKVHTFRRRALVAFLSILLVIPFPAFADNEDPLVMGIFPRRSAKLTFKMFTPLARRLSEQLGRPVNLETSASFKDFWDGVSTLRYDIVHYNQYHYIRSHKKLGYDVIAMNEEFGSASISGAIYVHVDSGINSLQQLKGSKIVFGGGPKAMMSYIIPTHLLLKAGLKKEDYQEDFAKSPPNAILSTYYKQSMAAGVGDIVLQLPSIKSKCNVSRLKKLAVSEPVAHLPWAVKGDMPAKLKSNIQSVLIGLNKNVEGKSVLEKAGLSALMIAEDNEYNRHREITFEVLGEQY
jgi:phosphonate transport system substrate-binding protein